MLRPLLRLASVLALLITSPAWAEEMLVVELRLAQRAVESLAWRDAAGDLLVERVTLDALGVQTPPEGGDRVSLDAIEGLTYVLDPANALILISCTSACYRGSEIGARTRRAWTPPQGNGGFFNVDLSATATEDESAIAGAFELGIFNRHGAGGTTWIAGGEVGDIVRMETRWTFDLPAHRARLRIGDSITRGSATGAPFRFGGVQLSTNFALDPGFIPYPTPSLRGEAATPSTVDLYIDGALRMREVVAPGPFSIVDAPVISGAGVAQIVVTDALGRQQVFAQPFYSSPTMLRPGLNDYSFALGAERRNFTRNSADYDRPFASGLVRRGITNTITAEGRVEGADNHITLGGGASFASSAFGQLDIALLQTEGKHTGTMSRIGWSRQSRMMSFTLEAQTATRDFIRLGEDETRLPTRLQGAAAVSVNLGRYGTAALSVATQDNRDEDDVRPISLSYVASNTRFGRIDITALHVESGAESNLTIGIGVSRQLRGDIAASARVERRRSRLHSTATVQRSPDLDGGVGWRVQASSGAFDRVSASVEQIGQRHEGSIELTHAESGDGARGQLAIGIAWMDRYIQPSRPIRGSFAFVDVGAANVRVLRDNRPAGATDRNGRLLVTGLRAYENNRISVAIDDLPLSMQLSSDEVEVAPGPRGGAIARFETTTGRAGVVLLVDAMGAPLQRGLIVTRAEDGARFPVGADGHVYLTDVHGNATLQHGACRFAVAPADLDTEAEVRCALQ